MAVSHLSRPNAGRGMAVLKQAPNIYELAKIMGPAAMKTYKAVVRKRKGDKQWKEELPALNEAVDLVTRGATVINKMRSTDGDVAAHK